ncbi:MAG TPA: hypothetical protein VGJ93_15840 [Desulfuromonadaceae bacterium]
MESKIKLFFLSLVAVSFALPAPALYAHEVSGQETKGKMQQVMKQHPELKMQMMQNPNALLAFAYRKNMLAFGKALDVMAHKAETVPQPFARIATGEMKRSLEQMEKYHTALHSSLPDETKAQLGDLPKQMDEHLMKVRSEVDSLSELAKGDQVASSAVISHTSTLMKYCEEMGMGMKGGKKDYHASDQKLMDQTKAEDAVLLKMVEDMNKGPMDKKLNKLADIVTKMVEQRAAANSRFDQVHKHMMQQMPDNHPDMGHAPGNGYGPHNMEMDEDEMDED